MTLVLSIGLACLWLVLACLFACVGALVLGDRGGLEDGWPAAHAAFWIGIATVTCGLLAWHLVLPANAVAFGVFVAAASVGCVVRRRLFVACLKRPPSWRMMLVVASAGVWVANHALDRAAIDDYLYEFQAVRWNHDFPIVPGLANLHGRLGFNESHHLLGAMLSVGPLEGAVNHVISGLFVMALVAYLAGGLGQLACQGRRAHGSCLLRALLVGPVVGLALFSYYGSTISTLKADIVVTCCSVVLSCALIELAEAEWGTASFNRAATLLVAVSAFAMSVKLSAVVFAALLAGSVLVRLAVEAWRRRVLVERPIRRGLVIAAVIVVLVPIRGVVLSGYPAYPATVFRANVDWRVPEVEAGAERAIITSWARLRPTYDPRELKGWGWTGFWAKDTVLSAQFAVVVPLMLTLMCAAGALFRGGSAGGGPEPVRRTPTWAYSTLIASSGVALVVWWLLAPSSRFAVGLFWAAAAASLAWSVERGIWSRGAALVAAGLAAAAALALSLGATGAAPGHVGVIVRAVATFGWLVLFAVAGRHGGVRLVAVCLALALAETGDRQVSFLVHGQPGDALAVVWLTPDRYMEDRTGYPFEARRTQSGLTVYVTSSTGYYTPLPNTRYFNPYLELRRAPSLSSGFRTRLPPDETGYGYSLDFRRPGRNASAR